MKERKFSKHHGLEIERLDISHSDLEARFSQMWIMEQEEKQIVQREQA